MHLIERAYQYYVNGSPLPVDLYISLMNNDISPEGIEEDFRMGMLPREVMKRLSLEA